MKATNISYIFALGSLIAGVMGWNRISDISIHSQAYPKILSEYGFFENGIGMKPSSQLIPYDLKVPLFSDYAEKFRYIYIPDGKQADVDDKGFINFPIGSALIKSFGYEKAGAMQLIETRVLLRRETSWVALPYVWNDEQNEAVLKLAGKRLNASFVDPKGQNRNINYAVPNKNQCKECHGLSGEVTPIGPKLRNLTDDSLNRLIKNEKLQIVNLKLPKDKARGLEHQARSYLDINCGHCHNAKGSASNSGLFLNYEENNPKRYGIYKRPVAAGRGSGGLEYAIHPGKPERSILLYRMTSNEAGIAMPQLSRSIVDEEGTDLISEWILEMK